MTTLIVFYQLAKGNTFSLIKQLILAATALPIVWHLLKLNSDDAIRRMNA
jgi:hypothetical protein